MLKLKLITPPDIEPVTLQEVKAQLRLDPTETDFDTLLNELIPAARQWCENYQNRAYITQTWQIAYDRFPIFDFYHQVRPFQHRHKPREIQLTLPRPPLQAVAWLQYTDKDKAVTTMAAADYLIDDFSEPAELLPAAVQWPHDTELIKVNAVQAQYTAGYDDKTLTAAQRQAMVPARIREAIILLVNQWFENPGCEASKSVYALLDLDRVVPI